MATSNFNATDNTLLPNFDSNWNQIGNTDLRINSNSVFDDNSGTDFAYYAAGLGADQYSQAKLVAISSGVYMGACVRCSGTTTATCYKLETNGPETYLIKMLAGAGTVLGSTTAFSWSVNDVLRIEVNGTSITCKRNGNVITQFGTAGVVTDADIASGQPGINFEGSGTAGRLDDWEGASLSGAEATVTPGRASLTINGRSVGTSSFTNVRIRDVLVNGSGQAVGNATDIGLRVWYSGVCAGAPDVSLNGMTTDPNGTVSWSIPTGTLAYQQPIFYVAQNSVSYSHYSCGRLIPNYE